MVVRLTSYNCPSVFCDADGSLLGLYTCHSTYPLI